MGIEADLQGHCDCKNQNCVALLDVDTILQWRQKYYLKVMGVDQQQVLLNLYRDSLLEEGHWGQCTKHWVEGNTVCRSVLCHTETRWDTFFV